MNIEKAEVAQRFSKSHQSYTANAVAQHKICQHLVELMRQNLTIRKFDRIFEIGCGSGNLTKLMAENFDIQKMYLNDLYSEVVLSFDQHQINSSVEWCIGDAEAIAYPSYLDLIVSSSALQWMIDLDHLFAKSHQALVSSKETSGLLCFSTFGQQNLTEIKRLTGQGLHYFTVNELKNKLQAQGFEVLYMSEHLEHVYFEHPKQVLQHLKATGVTATAQKYRWNKQSLERFYHSYRQFIITDEHENLVYPLTYHPIYVIARKQAQ